MSLGWPSFIKPTFPGFCQTLRVPPSALSIDRSLALIQSTLFFDLHLSAIVCYVVLRLMHFVTDSDSYALAISLKGRDGTKRIPFILDVRFFSIRKSFVSQLVDHLVDVKRMHSSCWTQQCRHWCNMGQGTSRGPSATDVCG